MGLKLLILLLIFFAITPNLGFFTIPSFLILFFIIITLLIFLIKPKYSQIINSDTHSKKLVPIMFYILLFYSSLYYGGLYQNKHSFLIGYLIFFTALFYVSLMLLLRKRISLIMILLAYFILSIWTLISSPHPIVDTMVAFEPKKAPFLTTV